MAMKKRTVFLLLFCFLFSLCSCTSAKPSAPLRETMAVVYAAVIDPHDDGFLQEYSENEIIENVPVAASLYTEAVAYASPLPSRGSVFMGFIPAKGRKDDLIAELKEAQKAAIASFDGYLPDQLQIAQNAVTVEKGGYLFFLMTEDNVAVEQALDELLEK